jgi:SHAQKYF class myb-like DNA-binding protein
MSLIGTENLNFSNIFSPNINGLFLPSICDNISNDFSYESKEELPSKQPVKFVLTKQEIPSVSLLQKKTIQKSNDSSVDSDNSNNGRWTKEEQNRFAEAVLKYGNDWKNIQNFVATRNITQVRSHAQKFLMKLKESSFLKDKGLNTNLSWTKVINFLNNNLTNDELKEVLFSVEQTGHKKMETKHKNLKKIQKKNVNKKSDLDEENETYSNIMDDTYSQSDNLYCSKYNCCAKNYLNQEYEEDIYNMKQKIRKQEEEEILQKFIDCFNNSYGENTLNTSFEENSIEDIESDKGFDFLNEIPNKYNNNLI